MKKNLPKEIVRDEKRSNSSSIDSHRYVSRTIPSSQFICRQHFVEPGIRTENHSATSSTADETVTLDSLV